MTRSQKKVYNWLRARPGYLKKSAINIHGAMGNDAEDLRDIGMVLTKLRKEYNPTTEVVRSAMKAVSKDVRAPKVVREGLVRLNLYDPKNVLIIGDTHEPFSKDGYLEHCIAVQKKYNCGTVVHIGDLVDNHAVSYHESDPDGRSPGDEFKDALARCQKWYDAFPDVHICIGNHDRLPFRKAYTAGLPKNWLKSYQEMFNSPKGWKWDFIHDINGVRYQHGTGMSGEMASVNAARENRQSTVIGHLHTVCNIRFLASNKDLIFGMSVGCGIDHTKYAFAYGRENTRKPVLSCSVVLDGKLPINIPMEI